MANREGKSRREPQTCIHNRGDVELIHGEREEKKSEKRENIERDLEDEKT